MTTKTFPPTGATHVLGKTAQANFIPELWSDETIATFKANLVVGGVVTNFQHNGKKGDTIHIPSPTRSAANAKAEGAAVTLISNVEGVVNITLDKHFEYSRLIEDFAQVQAVPGMRSFYTDDAGYALASQVDTDLHLQGESLQTGTTTDKSYDKGVIGGDGTTDYTDGTDNASDITDAGIRTIIQQLDDQDVPQSQRSFIIPPIMKNDLLGLSRFTEQAFVGEVGMANSIRNGRIGNVYGVEVLVSSNCPTTKSNSNRAALFIHKSALALVTQIGIRVQTQYKQEFLGTLLTADTLYGKAELRNLAGFAVIVPGS